MTTISLKAKLHPIELTTEELQGLVAALNDELRRRKEVGESPWTVDQVRLVLRQLEAGWPEQHNAVVAAARDREGRISRSKLLRLTKRDADANVNGFRKPFNTAKNRLTVNGHDLPKAEFPFSADYSVGSGGPGQAGAFYIPAASLPVVRAALGT